MTHSDHDHGPGPVERAVLEDLEELGDVDAGRRTLAAAAVRLARTLDGDAGMATAAVARELRETMHALTKEADDGDAARDLAALLSTPVGNAAHA